MVKNSIKYQLFSNTLHQIKQRFLLENFERNMRRINSAAVKLGVRVCFFDLFSSHYQFSKETIARSALHGPVVLLVLDEAHPAYQDRKNLKNIHVFLLDKRWIAFSLKWLRIPYLVTPASHVHPSTVRPDLSVVHTYHSLVSMHAVYGDDAFDGYTHFFACGPHHLEEIEGIRAARGLPRATVFEVGYPKLDELAKSYSSKSPRSSATKRVLIAPSWHPTNILSAHGSDLCREVLALGYELIIRPHPHFYERDQITMAMLREIAADSGGKVTIENPDKEFNSFWLADIMISDWSGVAFEFAFATGRPVVFVDAPRKVNSVELASLDLPIMEKEARSEVGVVVGSIDTLSDGIEEAFSYSAADWVDRIAKARVKYVFNFGDSAEAGSRVLKEIGAGAEMLPHSDVTRERLAELIEFYSHPLRDRDDLARHPIS